MSDSESEVSEVRRVWDVRQALEDLSFGESATFKGPLGDPWSVERGDEWQAWPGTEKPADPLHWPDAQDDGGGDLGLAYVLQYLAGKMSLEREVDAAGVHPFVRRGHGGIGAGGGAALPGGFVVPGAGPVAPQAGRLRPGGGRGGAPVKALALIALLAVGCGVDRDRDLPAAMDLVWVEHYAMGAATEPSVEWVADSCPGGFLLDGVCTRGYYAAGEVHVEWEDSYGSFADSSLAHELCHGWQDAHGYAVEHSPPCFGAGGMVDKANQALRDGSL